ncbi:hypothetical protein ACVDG5_008540 [Mesorhizobium sp. ORM6]
MSHGYPNKDLSDSMGSTSGGEVGCDGGRADFLQAGEGDDAPGFAVERVKEH